MTTATEIHGICKPGYERVRDAFTRNFEEHGEVGAGLSLVVAGETVVDLWDGHTDGALTRPWQEDTIVNTFSTTKGITTICALRLMEQGKLDPDSPAAEYWPEFAAAGKEKITVRQIMSHQAGLPGIDSMIPVEKAYDWEPLSDALAAQRPFWEPGSKVGYHAVTFGTLVGELIRRVTGKTVGAFWQDEIAEPFGIDFHIGFGEELDDRCATVIPAPLPNLSNVDHPLVKAIIDPTTLTFKAFMISPLMMVNPLYMNSREWRAAEVPAANGHGTARSLSRLYGALATGGELGGKQVLKQETIEMATQTQSQGHDEVLLFPTRFGLGFLLDIPEFQISPSGTVFGHFGMGGSFGLADPAAKLGVGYVMNKMMIPNPETREDPRLRGMFNAIYESV